MKPKIFVDGQEGTTGLQIHEYLAKRPDLEILKIDSDKRRDMQERKRLLNEADVVFLCLPDEAAIESVSLIENNKTRVIDASTAHRTAENWSYGFPELSLEHREAIKASKRVSNPGCHATGFIAAIYPLVKEGILPKDYPLTCTSLTGYSGAGKKAIEKYEDPNYTEENTKCPRHYALSLSHKHLPEMQKLTGISYPPAFAPVISNFFKGMTVSIPLHTRLLTKKFSAKDIHEFLSSYYENENFIRVMPFNEDSNLEFGCLDSEGCNDTNRLDIFVCGHEDQVILISRLDNLGKGASGAAIQNMNIMLGLDEDLGLKTE